MLMTEMHLARRKGVRFPQPDRKRKVQKSMGAIKHVLGERKRDKIAQYALKMSEMQDLEKKEHDELDDENELEEKDDEINKILEKERKKK